MRRIVSEVVLSIAIVNFNGRDELKACLESLIAHPPSSIFEVFVVDNDSGDGSPEMVAREYPWVELIRNGENAGFAAANNQALRLARGRYLLLLNPDTVVLEGSLDAMVRFMDEHEGTGALGPKLIDGAGRPEPGGYLYPTLWTEASHLAFWLVPSYERLLGLARLLRANRTRKVDWVSGACLMVRGEAVAEVGLLDESYFMYSEDADWCYRIRRAGWDVVYYPEVAIRHLWRSWGRISETTIMQHLASKHIFFHKNYGSRAARLLSVILISKYRLEALKNILKIVLTLGRAEAPKRRLKERTFLIKKLQGGSG